jgi:hypothetical protein
MSLCICSLIHSLPGLLSTYTDLFIYYLLTLEIHRCVLAQIAKLEVIFRLSDFNH